jgi:hypothetical protein
MVIFVFVVVIAACACFVVIWDGVSRFICIAHPESVVRMTHGASVTVAVFFYCFCEFFIACFVVDLNVINVGDLRHEFAQSA